jgi:hypothetical protein
VGITENPPWTDLSGGQPAGVEVDLDWRLHDVVVTPTRSLENEDEPSGEG